MFRETIQLRPNSSILFTGDSITDCNRGNPVYAPFGKGYVHFAANWLLARYPEFNLKISNTGISGNTVRDLKGRWETDCLTFKPDVLSILIGVNDCWRYNRDSARPEAVSPDEYETTYRNLLGQVRTNFDCQLVVMEPFLFCSDPANPILNDLQKYIQIVRQLSTEFNACLIRLQSFIDTAMQQVPPEKWSPDMVHPSVWAHAWLAQRWLEIIEP